MMGHDEFYHESLKRYTVVFGTMFNNIVIRKRDQAGAVLKRIKVPIAYGPAEKYLARLRQDPNLDRKSAITLPRMSFEMTNFLYAADRKLASTKSFRGVTASASSSNKVYVPVPYDISFQLNIMVLNAEDGTQILEQILPFFTPDWSNNIQLLDDPVLKFDVPLILTSVSTTDTYDGAFDQRRALVHTIDFVMKGYLIGPVATKKVIKVSKTHFYIDKSADPMGTSNTAVASIDISPGLDANGNPTSNSSITVPANTIFEGDDWDYIVEITDPETP